MRLAKTLLGFMLVICSIVVGLYIGIWWAFVGGIMGLIEAYKNNMDAMGMALNILRIIFASSLGWSAGLGCLVCGIGLMSND